LRFLLDQVFLGTSVLDIPYYNPVMFYVSAPSLKQPIKLQAPMCLSWHPRDRALTDDEMRLS
jgi:hypothetical protein